MPKSKVPTTSEERKEVRRKIAGVTVQDRMGLDEEWLDPDTTVDLPTELPEFEGQGLTPIDREDLEKYLDRLEEGGCTRGILYWCLGRLGEREGKPQSADVGRIPAKEEPQGKLRRRIKLPKLATREDMADVASAAKSAAHAIWKYKGELLLAADALEMDCQPPSGFVTESAFDAVESLNVLMDSLRWVRELAENWQTPSQTTLMKSKGVLYLLAYVSMKTLAKPSLEARNGKVEQLHGAPADLKKLKRGHADTISRLIGIYCELEIEPGDLITKLEGFRREHPVLNRKLVDLLAHMDAPA